MCSEVLHATSADFDSIVLQSDQPVLVDFYADWCMPCRMLAPTLDDLSKSYSGRAKIVKVDVEHAREIAAKYGVSSIPALYLFKDGKVGKTLVGLRPPSELQHELDQLIA